MKVYKDLFPPVENLLFMIYIHIWIQNYFYSIRWIGEDLAFQIKLYHTNIKLQKDGVKVPTYPKL